MSMHVPTIRPACYVADIEPANLPPRVEWAWDQGAACADAKDEDSRDRQAKHTPGCLFCSRRVRAAMIEDGTIMPHPHRVGRRPVPADPVAAERDQTPPPLPPGFGYADCIQ